MFNKVCVVKILYAFVLRTEPFVVQQQVHSHGGGESCNGNHEAVTNVEAAAALVPAEASLKSEKQTHKERDFGNKKDAEPAKPKDKKDKKHDGAPGESGPKKEKAPKDKKEPTGPALELSPGTLQPLPVVYAVTHL